MPRSPTPSATVRDRSRHEADRGRAELRRPHPRRAHPRIMISEAAAADCNAAVQAVMTHFASTGIPAYRAEEEQCELWLEQLPGDQLRVSGLGHVMDAEGVLRYLPKSAAGRGRHHSRIPRQVRTGRDHRPATGDVDDGDLTADDAGAIGMWHLVAAIHREYRRLGQLVREAEFGPYWPLLKRSVRNTPSSARSGNGAVLPGCAGGSGVRLGTGGAW